MESDESEPAGTGEGMKMATIFASWMRTIARAIFLSYGSHDENHQPQFV
jgi:hypothetical protein